MEGFSSFKTAAQRRTMEEPVMDVLDEEEPVYPDHKSEISYFTKWKYIVD